MNLEDLKKEIPFKWRVQSANKNGAKCVAYVDARDVQDILDKVCGQDSWQVKYSEHKGNLFCGIGIKIQSSVDGSYSWSWKEDCGTESNVEKQKGEASDAFKRAGVMWGIGRFLYSKKIITIKEVQEYKGKFYPTENGQKIWDITKYCNGLDGIGYSTKPTPPKKKEKLTDGELTDSLLHGNIEELRELLKKYDCTDLQKTAITVRGKELRNGK